MNIVCESIWPLSFFIWKKHAAYISLLATCGCFLTLNKLSSVSIIWKDMFYMYLTFDNIPPVKFWNAYWRNTIVILINSMELSLAGFGAKIFPLEFDDG